MEAQLQPPHLHGDRLHEEDPHHTAVHSVVEGEGEHGHHGEKKSVLKKVKEKAKKIKNTITKHGHEHEHGHGYEHDYRHDQMSEEDDDEDDEIENDPGFHGAPIHKPTVITGTKLPKQTEVNLENPTDHMLGKQQPNVGAGAHGYSGLDNPISGTGGHGSSSLYNPNAVNPPIIGAGAHIPSGMHNPSVDAPILGTGTHRASGLHNPGVDTSSTGAEAHRHSVMHNPSVDTPVLGTGAHRTTGLHNPGEDTHILGTGGHRARNLHNPGEDTHILGTGGHRARDLHNPGEDTPILGTGAHRAHGQHNPSEDTPILGTGAHRAHGQHNPDVDTFNTGAGAHRSSGMQNPNVATPNMGAGIPKPSGLHNPNVDTSNIGIGVHKPSGTSMAAKSRPPGPTMAVGPAATQDKGDVKIGPLAGLEKDPHSPNNSPQGGPPSNYETKGGREIDVGPLTRHLDNMHVKDGSKLEPVPESTLPHTGSHDQFDPQDSPTAHQFGPGLNPDQETPDAMPVDTTAGKVSSAGSVLANKAAAAKNMVASKLGYGGDYGHDSTRDTTPDETDRVLREPDKTPITTPVDTTAGRVSVATSVLAEKAAAAKNMVASKLGYGDQGRDSGRDTIPEETNRGVSDSTTGKGLADKAAAAKDMVASKLGYSGDQGLNTRDTSTEEGDKGVYDITVGKESSAASMLADKAAAAKNQVASKLGYGDQGYPTPEESHKGMSDTGTNTTAGKSSSAASTLADKATAAKNAVASKLGYGDQGQHPIKGAVPEDTDKGMSVKEYLAEKLRPGDEDKALSSAITDRLHKKEATKEETPVKRTSVIMKETPAIGKVTVSKEVAERLGPKHENKREGEDAVEAGMENTGGNSGVVDRLKGAVGSWLGKSSGTETAKHSAQQAHVSDAAGLSSGEDKLGRRLQESGN